MENLDEQIQRLMLVLKADRDAAGRSERGRYLSLAITDLERVQDWVARANRADETGPERAERYGQVAREAAGIDRPQKEGQA